jgi:hypothetical protein
MGMRGVCVWALVAFSTCVSLAQDQQLSKDDIKHCSPKIISRKDKSSPQLHFQPTEKYARTPVIAFEILPSGEVSKPRVKQKSGVQDIDRYALDPVRSLKFNNRPACPVVESQCGVTIDFAAN